MMRRIIISCIICLMVLAAFTGCSSSRKTYNELKGLMLLENVQLQRNRAFNSKHSIRARNDALKRYKKNSRELSAKRR